MLNTIHFLFFLCFFFKELFCQCVFKRNCFFLSLNKDVTMFFQTVDVQKDFTSLNKIFNLMSGNHNRTPNRITHISISKENDSTSGHQHGLVMLGIRKQRQCLLQVMTNTSMFCVQRGKEERGPSCVCFVSRALHADKNLKHNHGIDISCSC